MTDLRAPLPNDIERDPAHLAAAEWFVRLHGAELSIEDALAWQVWLNERPENAWAFARIEEVSQAVRTLAPASVAAGSVATDSYDASIPLKDWRTRGGSALGLPEQDSPAPGCLAQGAFRSRSLILALAALLAGVAFTLAGQFRATETAPTYTTAIGENRNITLSDGSRIALGGDTRLEVVISARARAVELVKGEALFRVAKDPNRPFEVRVKDTNIVAVGTAFDVQLSSDRAVVSVTEGRVVIEPVAHFLPVSVLQRFEPRLRTVHVDAGQQITAGAAGIEDPVEVDDPAVTTAWQTGRLSFRLQPLHYVLEDVNRYAPKPIVLEGAGLGSLVITGTVERGNIGGWISSLERAFDLQATEEGDRVVLRAR